MISPHPRITSSRFTFGGRVRRKLRAHALPDDQLFAAPVSLDPSAPDSTVAVDGDGVTLGVERYLDELRLWHDSHHPLSWERSGVERSQSVHAMVRVNLTRETSLDPAP